MSKHRGFTLGILSASVTISTYLISLVNSETYVKGHSDKPRKKTLEILKLDVVLRDEQGKEQKQLPFWSVGPRLGLGKHKPFHEITLSIELFYSSTGY